MSKGVLTWELLLEVREKLIENQDKHYKALASGEITVSRVIGETLNNVFNSEKFDPKAMYKIMSDGKIVKEKVSE